MGAGPSLPAGGAGGQLLPPAAAAAAPAAPAAPEPEPDPAAASSSAAAAVSPAVSSSSPASSPASADAEPAPTAAAQNSASLDTDELHNFIAGKYSTGRSFDSLVERGPTERDVTDMLTETEEQVNKHRIRALFDQLDQNEDGLLTRPELESELKRLKLPISSREIRQLLAHAGDRKHMEFEEFYQYCTNKEAQLREAFEAIDQSKDGVLEASELQRSLKILGIKLNKQQRNEMMRTISKTGKISWEDWREFFVLLPSSNIRDMFSYWQRASLEIGFGDDYSIPDSGQAEDLFANGRWWKQLVAGGVAGAVSRTATAPLDRLKIMYMAHATRQKRSLWNVLRDMWTEGGPRSFWRGNGVNIIKIAPETAIKFFAWEQNKRLFATEGRDLSVGERLMAGSLAGVVAQTSIYPMEVLKTRLALAKTGQFNSIWHCARNIAEHEGLRAFYRGLTPSLLGVIPYAGIDLAVYETLRSTYAHDKDGEPSVLALLACGTTSSACGQLASYPLSLVRTRLQMKSTNHGMIEEFRLVIQHGGFFALYRGLLPNFAKAVPAVGISYVIYEKMKAVLGLEHFSGGDS